MSERSKRRRALREARQEKQAKTVIKWIFFALIILAVIFIGYSMVLMS